jgi:hypothetical protein
MIYTPAMSWLVAQLPDLPARLEGDPDWCDPQIAGWWVWGMACWIGSEFCSGNGPWQTIDGKLVHLGDNGRGVNRQLVHLGDNGRGVNRQLVHLGSNGQGVTRQLVHLGNNGQGVKTPATSRPSIPARARAARRVRQTTAPAGWRQHQSRARAHLVFAGLFAV